MVSGYILCVCLVRINPESESISVPNPMVSRCILCFCLVRINPVSERKYFRTKPNGIAVYIVRSSCTDQSCVRKKEKDIETKIMDLKKTLEKKKIEKLKKKNH
uniref:Uncharacterized protein n=1 Tax=Cacopsylla melanoneura TaxID=428564 RepID=A0A8D8ZDZ8_9HEMI